MDAKRCEITKEGCRVKYSGNTISKYRLIMYYIEGFPQLQIPYKIYSLESQ
jgi:hypothetical protein